MGGLHRRGFCFHRWEGSTGGLLFPPVEAHRWEGSTGGAFVSTGGTGGLLFPPVEAHRWEGSTGGAFVSTGGTGGLLFPPVEGTGGGLHRREGAPPAGGRAPPVGFLRYVAFRQISRNPSAPVSTAPVPLPHEATGVAPR